MKFFTLSWIERFTELTQLVWDWLVATVFFCHNVEQFFKCLIWLICLPYFLSSPLTTNTMNFSLLICSICFCRGMLSFTCSIPDFTCISSAKVAFHYSIHSHCKIHCQDWFVLLNFYLWKHHSLVVTQNSHHSFVVSVNSLIGHIFFCNSRANSPH